MLHNGLWNAQDDVRVCYHNAGTKIVDHSDVVGASPVGAAPTTSSFSTQHLVSMNRAETTARWNEHHLSFGIWCGLYSIFYGSCRFAVDVSHMQIVYIMIAITLLFHIYFQGQLK